MIEIKHVFSDAPDGSRIRKMTIASGPVILKDGKVLLDKHGGDGLWKFPGGKLRDDESPRQTAVREAKEELGIDVTLVGDPLFFLFEHEHEGVPEIVVLIHYLATYTGEIVPGRDVEVWDWHDIKNLPTDCAPNIKPILERAASLKP